MFLRRIKSGTLDSFATIALYGVGVAHLEFVPTMGLIRFGGRVDQGDFVPSASVEESLQALGGIGIDGCAPWRSPGCEACRCAAVNACSRTFQARTNSRQGGAFHRRRIVAHEMS